MSSKRHIRRRSCESKKGYNSIQEVRAGLYKLRQHTGTLEMMNIYKCQFCNKYHLGHPNHKQKQSAHAKMADKS